MPIGWEHPDTARYYEAFCARHARYDDANRALTDAAELALGDVVRLDRLEVAGRPRRLSVDRPPRRAGRAGGLSRPSCADPAAP